VAATFGCDHCGKGRGKREGVGLRGAWSSRSERPGAVVAPLSLCLPRPARAYAENDPVKGKDPLGLCGWVYFRFEFPNPYGSLPGQGVKAIPVTCYFGLGWDDDPWSPLIGGSWRVCWMGHWIS